MAYYEASKLVNLKWFFQCRIFILGHLESNFEVRPDAPRELPNSRTQSFDQHIKLLLAQIGVEAFALHTF